MHGTELDSFIFKFHQLWKAGVTAHLDLDTHAGEAWVGLRVHLGHGHQHGGQPKPRRNPAYYRRQERRKAAKAAAPTTTSATPAEKAVRTFKEAANIAEIVIKPAEKNREECIENAEKANSNAEKANSDMNSRNAEKAFSCDFCEKTFGSVQDLKRHEEKKHNNCSGSPIPQLDGEDDSCLDYSSKSELLPITPTRVPSSSSSTRPPCTPTRGSHPSTSTSPVERKLTCAPPSPRTPPGLPPPCTPNYTTMEEMKAAIREAFRK